MPNRSTKSTVIELSNFCKFLTYLIQFCSPDAVTLDPLDRPDAGYHKVSTNIKTMAIDVPVALSPLDRDVEPEHHRQVTAHNTSKTQTTLNHHTLSQPSAKGDNSDADPGFSWPSDIQSVVDPRRTCFQQRER